MRAIDLRATIVLLLLALALPGCGGRSDLGLLVAEIPDGGDPRATDEGGLDASGSDGRLDGGGRDSDLDAGRSDGDGGRSVDAGPEPTCDNDTSVDSCGPSCSPCPGPPGHGHATCDGSSCGLACDTGFLACEAACVDSQTDGVNCGACGHDCLGGACVAGACQPVTILTGLDWPSGIAVDATYLYWTSSQAGTVQRMPIAGGSPTTLASGQQEPMGIAVDGSSVYFTTYLGGTLMKMPLAGGSPVNLYTAAVSKDGPYGVAVDASSLYFTSFWGGTVLAMPLAGGAPLTLLSGQGQPGGLDLDATSLYCSYLAGPVQPTDGSTIVKLPRAGGPATTVVHVPTVVSDIAVDATRIYWTTEYDGTVMEMPLAGGSPTTLVSGQYYPDGIAVDARSIYWTTTNDPTKAEFASGTIMRLAKPAQ